MSRKSRCRRLMSFALNNSADFKRVCLCKAGLFGYNWSFVSQFFPQNSSRLLAVMYIIASSVLCRGFVFDSHLPFCDHLSTLCLKKSSHL